METREKVSIFWFRRDLRLADNHGLSKALQSSFPVLPIFIFDTDIIEELPKEDARISFIYKTLTKINNELQTQNSSINIYKGRPVNVWKRLCATYSIHAVFVNEDYEPYAIKRDQEVKKILSENGISFHRFKDQVVFEKNDILKGDSTPYTVYTPFKNKWLSLFNNELINPYKIEKFRFITSTFDFPLLDSLGFVESNIKVKPYKIDNLTNYAEERNFPSVDGTSHLSVHLRFGTVSIREILRKVSHLPTFLNELIWREFFMQILFHFPNVVNQNFKSKYNCVEWRNNAEDFEKWCAGETGYPLVDAGMRELNATGYMHNRVRMITAGFLCKHLLIDWRWGETYFAKKLLDYEFSSNNGNWQWSAGTGCDSAPYFRIFNPSEQVKKFDKNQKYIKKWIPEFNTLQYPAPMVKHGFARKRALEVYIRGLTE